MPTKLIKLVVNIFLSLVISSVSMAKEVKLFPEGNIPSAEEMADILLNNAPTNTDSIVKTRSVSFGVAKPTDTVSVGLPIKFDFNSSQLNNASLAYLQQLGTMLNLEKMASESIMIVGHTDASGSASYNQHLSEMRAQTVKNFLISNYQINPQRLQTMGKGETETLPGEPKNAAINRRVEFYRIP